MNLNTILRLTYNLYNLIIFKENSQILSNKVVFRYFGTSNAYYKKNDKNKKKEWFWQKNKGDELKIITPGNCKLLSPILTPLCKVAMIAGGGSGFGYFAADELLSRGARNVIIADSNAKMGKISVQKLCESYGKDRAYFIQCDVRDAIHFEGAFEEAIGRYKEVHVLFSDLDQNTKPLTSSSCGKFVDDWSNTKKASVIGLKYIGKENGGPGGIIVNCASIFGFMGWPQHPSPVYCHKEPVIETTMDIAKEHTFESTGVRFVALCPSNKQFEKIGLPDIPEVPEPNNNHKECTERCTTENKRIIGPALTHVMAWANTGSAWFVPPHPSLRELPRLIHFPKSPEESVNPNVYQDKPCPVSLKAHCAKILPESSPMDQNAKCDLETSKTKECKRLFSKKK